MNSSLAGAIGCGEISRLSAAFRPPRPRHGTVTDKGKHPHMARNKIALIGSGMIGGTLAHMVGLK
ncbi:MAG: hypothetical protein EKK31_28385, partial [Hyphomicrobiales bacterium]